jgi:hypothetical protein
MREAESQLQEDQAIAEAYAQGMRDATKGPFPRPQPDQHLLTAARTYALGDDGGALEGSARLAWVRASAAEYRLATADAARYQRGFEPRSWLLWLQAGKPVERAPQSNGRGAPAVQRGGYGPQEMAEAQARFAEERDRKVAEEKARYAAAGVKDPWEWDQE